MRKKTSTYNVTLHDAESGIVKKKTHSPFKKDLICLIDNEVMWN
jgi:hypothetical protein